MPTPRFASSLVVPTQAPIVDCPSDARYEIGPIGVSTFSPRKAATSLSVSVEPALRIASTIDRYVIYPTSEPSTGYLSYFLFNLASKSLCAGDERSSQG